ncbi:MAG: tetratricopeptide repeat protein [Deltaproteobacteria bacterium]|nr:tetratricopeptide repeat protein [Deltaproteobacteria bacterium]
MSTDTPVAALLLLLQVTLWCALPFLLRPVLSRVSAATRHLVLMLTLVGALALPILFLTGPSWHLPVAFLPNVQLPGSELPGSEIPNSQLAGGQRPLVDSSSRGLPGGQTAGEFSSLATSLADETPRSLGKESAALLSVPAAGSGSPESPRGSSVSTGAFSPLGPRPSPTTPTLPLLARGFMGQSWFFWLVAVWGLGFLNAVWRVVGAVAAVRGTIREAGPIESPETMALVKDCCHRVGLTYAPQLRESFSFPVPFAWTSTTPTVVLPPSWRGWDSDRLRVVLVHELAHLRRGDGWALWLGRLATALWWFHPLVRRVERWARWECERAADDLVLLTGSPASDYAEHLIAIGRPLLQPLPIGVSLMMSSRPDLKNRLKAILRADQPRRRFSRRLAVVGAALAVLLAGSLAGMRLDSKVSAQEAQDPPARSSSEMRADSSGAQAEISAESSHRHGGNHSSRAHSYGSAHQGHGAGHGRAVRGDSKLSLIEGAYLAHQAGRYQEAIEAFEAAAAKGMDPATSLYNAACGYSLSGRAQEAQDTLRRALEAGWDDPEMIAEDSDFDPLRSRASFQELLDEAFAKAGRSRDSLKHYRYRTAQESLHMLQNSGSKKAQAWYRVGTRLLQLRDLPAASEALEKAARLDPEGRSSAWYNLACARSLAGQEDAALEALQRAIEDGYSSGNHMMRDPDLSALRNNAEFKRLVALAKDLDLDRYREALWKRGENGEHLHSKGEGHWELTEYSVEVWEPAVDFYRQFVKDRPTLGVGWFNLGYALHFSSRFEEAIEAFERARDLGHRPGLATYNVACGLAKLNRVDAALTALERSVEMGFSGGNLDGDRDLDGLRAEPRFRQLVLAQELKLENDHS